MRTTTIAIALLLSLSSLVAAEVLFVQPTIGVSPGTRGFPEAAAGANRILSVWAETRNPLDSRPSIWGRFLDRSGAPIGDRTFRIATDAIVGAEWIAVASDGRDFLVAYSTAATNPLQVRFVRVTEAGQVLPTPAVLNGGGDLQLIFTGGRYVLGYILGSHRLAVLDMNGQVLRSDIVLTTDVSDFTTLRLAADGRGGFAASWIVAFDGRIRVVVLTVEQILALGFGPFETGTAPERGHALRPSLAWNGSEYLVTWVEWLLPESQNTFEVRARRIGANGEVLSGVVTLHRREGFALNPHAAWTGSQWLIAGAPSEQQAMRVSRALEVVETVILTPGALELGEAISVEDGALVVWRESFGDRPAQVRGEVFTAAGGRRHPASGNGVLLSQGPAALHSSTLVPCSQKWMATWIESSDLSRATWAFVTAGGIATAPAHVAASTRNQFAPDVACGPTMMFVWRETDGLRNIVFGRVLGQPVFELGATTQGSEPTVTWAGNRFLVTWQDAQTRQLLVQPRTENGVAIAAPTAVQDPRENLGDRNAAVAWNGRDVFLAWQREQQAAFTQIIILQPIVIYHELQSLLLTPELHRVGPTTTAVTGNPENGYPSAGLPAAAASPDGFVLVWAENVEYNRSLVRALRYTPNGFPLDSAPLTLAEAPASVLVDATFNGRDYELSFDQQIVALPPTGPAQIRSRYRALRTIETLSHTDGITRYLATQRDPLDDVPVLYLGVTEQVPPAPPRRRAMR